jgi:putative transcriptional regulator
MTKLKVREIRIGLKLSQPEFSARFGFNLGTLRQWEQGRRRPDSAARVLLAVIAYAPEIVDRAKLENE